MLGLLLDRLNLADLFKGPSSTFMVLSRPKDGHFFLEPVLITARSLYEANREFDVSYPERKRMRTVEAS